MSSAELKIRSELEMDIERDMEEEIKDGIYQLALRLNRFYQRQKERNARELSEAGYKNQKGIKSKTLCEVNISIKMEGGTKIEIKEIKNEARETGRPQTSRSENMPGVVAPDNKKFDWVKTLRSGRGPLAANKKNESSHHQNKILNKEHGFHQNHLKLNLRRNSASDSGLHKRNVNAENKLLELGWRI